MKLKKWLAASAAAMILVSGASAVSAASITTAGDQKLDLGSSISVLPGERTFFGGQFHDWLLTGNVEGTIQEILAQGNVFPENSVSNKQFASVAASILKSAKVYQVCASANDTYYQGMVLSIAVSDNDMTKLLLALNAAQAEASPVIEPETQQPLPLTIKSPRAKPLLPPKKQLLKAKPSRQQPPKQQQKKL